jgi:mediator of RNA polymerase II transcription subunit 16
MELHRLEDISTDKYIVSVDVIEHGTVLAVTHENSSVSFYDTRTMAVFNGLDDANTVTCLAQAGFQYPIETPGGYSFQPNSSRG